jgi:hypothetical protein
MREMKKVICAIAISTFLVLAALGFQTGKAQNAPGEQLSVSISPSGTITALAVYFTATISGGTPPYSFQWYCNGTPLVGAHDEVTWDESLNFTFTSHILFTATTASSTYIVSLVASDSLNATASSNATVATPKPSLHIELSRGSSYLTNTIVGQPVYFTADVTGGTPPYRYQWYFQPFQFGNTVQELRSIGGAMEGDSAQNFIFITASPGHYLISVRVWDSLNTEGYFMSLPPGIWVNVNEEAASSPTPIPSPTENHTSSPSPTPASTARPTPSLTPSPTLTPTPSTSPTPSPTQQPTSETQSTSPTINQSIDYVPNIFLCITGITAVVIVGVAARVTYFKACKKKKL